jgi:hypothetical protein
MRAARSARLLWLATAALHGAIDRARAQGAAEAAPPSLLTADAVLALAKASGR